MLLLLLLLLLEPSYPLPDTRSEDIFYLCQIVPAILLVQLVHESQDSVSRGVICILVLIHQPPWVLFLIGFLDLPFNQFLWLSARINLRNELLRMRCAMPLDIGCSSFYEDILHLWTAGRHDYLVVLRHGLYPKMVREGPKDLPLYG